MIKHYIIIALFAASCLLGVAIMRGHYSKKASDAEAARAAVEAENVALSARVAYLTQAIERTTRAANATLGSVSRVDTAAAQAAGAALGVGEAWSSQALPDEVCRVIGGLYDAR